MSRALALCLLCCAPGKAELPGPLVPASLSRTVDPPIYDVAFRFDTGAPLLAGAAIGRDGVYVASTEGYLHALRPDGSYRWSYTVSGNVHRAPVVLPNEMILVATVSHRIYAIRPEGTLFWVWNSRVPIGSELELAPNGHVYFVGTEQHLYGITPRGAVTMRVKVGASKLRPTATAREIWVGTEAGEAVSVYAHKAEKTPLLGPVLAPPIVTPEGSYWVTSEGLVALDARRAERFRIANVRHIAHANGILVATTTSGEVLLVGSEGRELARAALGEKPSAPALIDPEQNILIPTERGNLLVLDRSLSEKERFVLARSVLHQPLWHAAAKQVIVTAGEGLVFGIQRLPALSGAGK